MKSVINDEYIFDAKQSGKKFAYKLHKNVKCKSAHLILHFPLIYGIIKSIKSVDKSAGVDKVSKMCKVLTIKALNQVQVLSLRPNSKTALTLINSVMMRFLILNECKRV